MTSTKSMTRQEVEETLKRYAAALLELGRQVPLLRNEPLGSKLAEAIGAVDRLRSDVISRGDEGGERLHFLVTAVLPEQMETIQLALARSAELARPGASPSAVLSLICLDFLATNDFKFANEEQRLRFLAKFERLMGYKLVIIDPEAGEVVYGLKALERLARLDDAGTGDEQSVHSSDTALASDTAERSAEGRPLLET